MGSKPPEAGIGGTWMHAMKRTVHSEDVVKLTVRADLAPYNISNAEGRFQLGIQADSVVLQKQSQRKRFFWTGYDQWVIARADSAARMPVAVNDSITLYSYTNNHLLTKQNALPRINRETAWINRCFDVDKCFLGPFLAKGQLSLLSGRDKLYNLKYPSQQGKHRFLAANAIWHIHMAVDGNSLASGNRAGKLRLKTPGSPLLNGDLVCLSWKGELKVKRGWRWNSSATFDSMRGAIRYFAISGLNVAEAAKKLHKGSLQGHPVTATGEECTWLQVDIAKQQNGTEVANKWLLPDSRCPNEERRTERRETVYALKAKLESQEKSKLWTDAYDGETSTMANDGSKKSETRNGKGHAETPKSEPFEWVYLLLIPFFMAPFAIASACYYCAGKSNARTEEGQPARGPEHAESDDVSAHMDGSHFAVLSHDSAHNAYIKSA